LAKRFAVEVVSSEKHDRVGVPGFDSSHSVLEHVQRGGAAIGVLHEPLSAKAESPNEVCNMVGLQGE
jgi:hypothetical protein